MIYIIGNTLFGYPKMADIQIDYFKNWLIPYLKKVYREGDVLVHTGNIFYNKQSVNFKVLKDTFEILDELSTFIQIFFLKGSNDEFSMDLIARNKNIKIIKETKKVKNIMFVPEGDFLMPDNDTEYLFFHTPLKEISEIKRSFNGFYENEKGNDTNICIGSPYQLNKDFSINNHGLYEFSLKQNELRLIENNYSPKFKEIYVNNIDELSTIQFNKKDFVDLIVDSTGFEKAENRNKLDIFVNNNGINGVFFVDNLAPPEKDIVINNNEIRDILNENANNDVKDNLKEIFTIYDNTRK